MGFKHIQKSRYQSKPHICTINKFTMFTKKSYEDEYMKYKLIMRERKMNTTIKDSDLNLWQEDVDIIECAFESINHQNLKKFILENM